MAINVDVLRPDYNAFDVPPIPSAISNLEQNNYDIDAFKQARQRGVNKRYMSKADDIVDNATSMGGVASGMVGFSPKVGGALTAGLLANTTSQVGSAEANSGYLGHLQPFYVIKRKIPYPEDKRGIGELIGKPSREYVESLSAYVDLQNVKHPLTGLTKCLAVNVKSLRATEEEKNIIESYLKGGVIL